MAVELLKTALKVCHFANYDESSGENATQITIISENKREIDKFLSTYDIRKISDVKCNFLDCPLYSSDERNTIIELIGHENAVTTIAICSDDSEENYVYSMQLPSIAYDKDVDIFVQYETYSKYIGDQEMHPHTQNINFFGFKNSGLEIRRSFDTAFFMNKYLTDLNKKGKSIGEINQSVSNYFKTKGGREQRNKWYKPSFLKKRERLTKEEEEMIDEWYKLSFPKKRLLLAYFDTIPSLFDSLDITLHEGEIEPDSSVFEKLEKYFGIIKKRQFQALSVLINNSDKNKIVNDDWELSNMFFVNDIDDNKEGLLLQWFKNNKKQLENKPFYITSKYNDNK